MSLWMVSRAAGVVALVLLTATVVLGTLATAPTRSATWPRWARQALHRDLALLSLGALAVHVWAVVVDGFVDIAWYAAVLPFASAYGRPWVALGTLAFDAVLAVIGTSLLRVRLGHRTWWAVHRLVYAAWPLAVLHYLLTGTDAGTPWGLLLAAAALAAVGAAVALRVTRPPARALARVRTTTAVAGVGAVLAGGALAGWLDHRATTTDNQSTVEQQTGGDDGLTAPTTAPEADSGGTDTQPPVTSGGS